MPPCKTNDSSIAFFSILMVCPQFHPLVGGYERSALRLSAQLAATGHLVTIITEQRNKQWPKAEHVNGLRIRRLWCVFQPRVHLPTSLLSLFWFLLTQGRQFQIWHIHQYGPQAVLTIALGKLLNRPVILKLTSSEQMSLMQSTATLPLTGVCTWLLQRVNNVIAMTEETYHEAVHFGFPERNIVKIGNGIDTDCFQPLRTSKCDDLRRKHGIKARGVVVSVGRLSPEKNHEGLLEAWRLALPELPQGWKLLLIGDGHMRESLQSLIVKYNLDQTVRIVGQQDNVEEWLALADIYVMTSHNEGLSNTMLEAMATGLPVITTEVSGTKENIREHDAGIVVPCGDMNGIASAIIKMVSSKDIRKQQGKHGHDVIARHYSISHVTEKYLELYQQLVVSKTRNVPQ